MDSNNTVTKIQSDIDYEKHISSKINADTLFTFMDKYDYLIEILKQKMISPRYCTENLEYLKIKKLNKISFPMKCFCDINLHKLNEHLDFYGYYGIAFSKQWGMKNGIQPVQYINPYSTLCKEFGEVFAKSLDELENDKTQETNALRSLVLFELMYYKPYSGKIRNRNTNTIENKCFTDECEWRYTPNVANKGYTPLYFNEKIINSGNLIDLSNSMLGVEEISLKFSYDDIKYIVVKTKEDLNNLIDTLISLQSNNQNKDKKSIYRLISKIIIWDNSKGDF